MPRRHRALQTAGDWVTRSLRAAKAAPAGWMTKATREDSGMLGRQASRSRFKEDLSPAAHTKQRVNAVMQPLGLRGRALARCVAGG